MGWPNACDEELRAIGCVGTICTRTRGGRNLQIRNPAHIRGTSLIEERSVRLPLGTSAQHRLDRRSPGPSPMERFGLDRMAIEERLVVLAHLHLRDPSWFLAAGDRGRQPLAILR